MNWKTIFRLTIGIALALSMVVLACTSKKESKLLADNPAQASRLSSTLLPSNDSLFNPAKKWGHLSVVGNKIVDEKGKPVVLRGMSFFWSQWIGKYYTPEVVKWLKDDWRCTVVRAALAVDHNGYLNYPEHEKRKIKTVIEAAISEGLYVVIDWHDHEAEKHVTEAKAFFGEMAKLYGHYPNVIYETYNEPLAVSWSNVIKPYHETIIDTIRAHDPDNLIICGTRNWSMQVNEPAADPIIGENIAYTLHFYAGTHKKRLRDRADQALQQGIALMVTEYGTADAPDLTRVDEEETKAWWDWLEENQISYINWSVADKVEASSVLKPGTSTEGAWPLYRLTESGLLVRGHLRLKNQL